MDASPTGLAKFFVPRLPGIVKQALSHSLSLSPTSSKWDLRTEMTVHVLRSLMAPGKQPAPIGVTQERTLQDPGVKGDTWIAKATIPAPQDEGLREATFQAIADMGDGSETYTRPDLVPLSVEWTGFRDAKSSDLLPDVSESEKYSNMMKEPTRTSKTTILYFHGGAYFMCGFGTHRASVAKLARSCNGRALSVGYRLAPKAAFPAQLLDALNAYLYLLYPPTDALHEPVPANEIVFAGDSAGGNLAFALLQLLLQFRRKSSKTGNPTIRYHGTDVEVPLPAGVSANSGWFDVSRAMPSLVDNAKYDYLPAANHDAVAHFPHDSFWPTDPPRGDIFCDLSLLCHPLVSPMAAPDWTGAPPLWIETGEELLTDEDAVLAVQAVSQGVQVQWEQYEAMPHCFAMLLPSLPTSSRCVKSWGDFCRKCVEGEVQTSGTWIEAKTGAEKSVNVSEVTQLGFDEAVARMRVAQDRRRKGWEKEGKSLPKLALA